MTTFPLASIPATEVPVLHSAVANQDYLISVALPFHYTEHPEAERIDTAHDSGSR